MGGFSNSSVRVPGSETTAREAVWVNIQGVAPRYFEIIGSKPLTGREFDRNDTSTSQKVAVVNQVFVRKFLPGETHPLDRVLNFEEGKAGFTGIVGVVRDIRHLGLREEIAPTVYLPAAQKESGWGTVLLRSELPLDTLGPAIRRELAGFGPRITASEPRTICQRIDDSIFRDRLLATLGGFFGGLALALAAIGLYGVVAYGTARRAREIGIRIALGARRGAVLWMILRDALVLVALGLIIGLPVSIAAARQVASVLFGIRPADTSTYATTICVLLAIGAAAAFLPARRASRLDPSQVLRNE